ncbi:hypothetical protein GGX14DRAFT_572828 [Mycena pura]|uniref:DUF6532 domain-containing protein n=1 Tax=Mycena pura TaxID=153505 RepID=A0AAD6V119_9AGAR|nr:hypothetical protein GGX14DRAFT_572828 [Mycena pura]
MPPPVVHSSDSETEVRPQRKVAKNQKATKESAAQNALIAQLQARVEKLSRKTAKQQKLLAAKTTDDDGSDLDKESEESDGEGGMQFAASKSIRTLDTVPAPPLKSGSLPKPKKAQAPKPKPRNSLMVPPSSDATDNHLPTSPSPANGQVPGSLVPSSPGPDLDSNVDVVTGQKRTQSSRPSSPAPTKRHKATLPEPTLAKNYVHVPGKKPAAGDYEPPANSIIIYAANHYGARILAKNAKPDDRMREVWARETFKDAGKKEGSRYAYTPRIGKIIIQRGSQVRGKKVEAFRALTASHFDFVHDKKALVIASNINRYNKLIKSSRFHYKNATEWDEKPTGFAEHKIFTQARSNTIFRADDSIGVVFPQYFQPLSLECIALDIATLHHCIEEWSTGKHVSSEFKETKFKANYDKHLAAAQEWNDINPTVVGKIRQKMYIRASASRASKESHPEPTAGIDAAQADALRAELSGRTGDTDSEVEGSVEPEGDT